MDERTSQLTDAESDAELDEGSLTERAYRRIEEMIATLQLEPGEVLTETALAQRLGIGRTPVREALQRLAGESMVTILPRRGILVSQLDFGRHLRLLEVRRELERLIARSAARRATPDERRAFAELAEALERAAADGDALGFMRLDRRFNAMTLAASRNEFAAKAMRHMQGLSRRFWYQHYQTVLDLPRCARLHKDVAAAIAQRDQEAAAAASDRLIDYIEEFARATV
jgi:DNA-binding GntR family transcriptional regulator